MAKEEQATQEAAETKESKALENFDWDETGSGDFFNIKDSAIEEEKVVVPKEKEEVEEEETPTPANPKKEKTAEEKDFFGQTTEEEATSEAGEEESQEEEDYYTTLTSTMKEKGIFQNIEVPEDEEITEDKFIELQDEEIDARVEEALDGFMDDLDGDAKAFLKYKKEGGDTEEFFQAYSKATEVPKGDIEDKFFQEKLSRYYYKNIEKLDDEDIEDRIEWIKDSGKLEKYAEKQQSKIEQLEAKSKEDLQTRTKASRKQQEENRREFVDSVQKTVDKTTEVNNFKFNPKKNKQLHAFITKPTVKVDKNQYVTGMQQKLQAALKNPEKMLVLASLLMSDFDFGNVVAATTTETTKKVKKDLQRSKTVRPTGSGKSKVKKSLADYF